MKQRFLAAVAATVCIGVLFTACADESPTEPSTQEQTQPILTGWHDQHYYLPDGSTASGWVEIDGTNHYFLPDGSPASGWVVLPDGTHYFTQDGCYASGWAEIDGTRHFFDLDGLPASGWVMLEEGNTYFLENGTTAAGWLTLPEGTYYFSENGIPCTLWQELDGARYYFDESGILQTGWLTEGEYSYYLQENGVMATGATEIDGTTQYFTPDGIHVLLVNPWIALPDDYAANLLEFENGMLVEESCLAALQQMFDDCRVAGYRPLVCSAYRTYNDQVYLYNRKVNYFRDQGYSYGDAQVKAGTIVAVPGTSEHHTGLAFDIIDRYHQVLDSTQADTETQKWLMEHCYEYGFILRYPKDTTSITGIIWEPWHYRYVGTAVSIPIRDAGVTLEEYLGFTHE